MKLVAVLGDGDWFDASVEHLALPDGTDMEECRIAYDVWYEGYCAAPRGKVEYLSLADWLKKYRGARDANGEEIEVVREGP